MKQISVAMLASIAAGIAAFLIVESGSSGDWLGRSSARDM
jgi:hypothetical protein